MYFKLKFGEHNALTAKLEIRLRILCQLFIENDSGEDWAKIRNCGGLIKLKWEFIKEQAWDGKSEILDLSLTESFRFQKSD